MMHTRNRLWAGFCCCWVFAAAQDGSWAIDATPPPIHPAQNPSDGVVAAIVMAHVGVERIQVCLRALQVILRIQVILRVQVCLRFLQVILRIPSDDTRNE